MGVFGHVRVMIDNVAVRVNPQYNIYSTNGARVMLTVDLLQLAESRSLKAQYGTGGTLFPRYDNMVGTCRNGAWSSEAKLSDGPSLSDSGILLELSIGILSQLRSFVC
jgi:hypothetical protein